MGFKNLQAVAYNGASTVYVFKNDSTFCRSLRLGGAMSIAALYFEWLKG